MQNLNLAPAYGASVTVPEDGELITAAVGGQGRGPIRPSLQELGNRAEYLKVRSDLFEGLLALGQRERPFLATYDGDTLIVGPTGPLVFSDGAGGYTIGRIDVDSSFTISQSLDQGVLASNSWYYVYGYLNGNQIKVEISLTAPDSGRRIKTGIPSRVYFGSFRTVAGAAVLPFSAVNGISRYLNSPYSQNDLSMVIASTVSVPTNEASFPIGPNFKTCGAVPPNTRHVLLGFELVGSGTTQQFLFRTAGAGPGLQRQIATAANMKFSMELPISSSQTGYWSNPTGGVLSASVEVLGYTE